MWDSSGGVSYPEPLRGRLVGLHSPPIKFGVQLVYAGWPRDKEMTDTHRRTSRDWWSEGDRYQFSPVLLRFNSLQIVSAETLAPWRCGGSPLEGGSSLGGGGVSVWMISH